MDDNYESYYDKAVLDEQLSMQAQTNDEHRHKVRRVGVGPAMPNRYVNPYVKNDAQQAGGEAYPEADGAATMDKTAFVVDPSSTNATAENPETSVSGATTLAAPPAVSPFCQWPTKKILNGLLECADCNKAIRGQLFLDKFKGRHGDLLQDPIAVIRPDEYGLDYKVDDLHCCECGGIAMGWRLVQESHIDYYREDTGRAPMEDATGLTQELATPGYHSLLETKLVCPWEGCNLLAAMFTKPSRECLANNPPPWNRRYRESKYMMERCIMKYAGTNEQHPMGYNIFVVCPNCEGHLTMGWRLLAINK